MFALFKLLTESRNEPNGRDRANEEAAENLHRDLEGIFIKIDRSADGVWGDVRSTGKPKP